VFRTDGLIKNALAADSRRMEIITRRQQTPRNNLFGAPPGFLEVLDQLFRFFHDVTIGIDVSF
jgi:hypothetical protein